MEENLNELLELKPEPTTPTENCNSSSFTSEKAITIISYVFLVLGIILDFGGIMGFLAETHKYHPEIEDIFMSLAMFIVGFICIVVWAILKALSNISTTLKEIKDKMK